MLLLVRNIVEIYLCATCKLIDKLCGSFGAYMRHVHGSVKRRQRKKAHQWYAKSLLRQGNQHVK